MRCSYCGNAYVTDDPRCHGCGSPRNSRGRSGFRDANELYAEVGHALITGEPDRSRALLEKIIGSPQTEPKRLWTERSVKVAMVIGLIWMFPMVAFGLVAMAMPFVIGIYLPYRGLQAVFDWIRGGEVRR